MRIAKLNQIFAMRASHGGLPCDSAADAPFNPTRPVETSGAEGAELSRARR